ncbi:hypothetical protein V5O48_003598, partial [Marasmius crinis-equi]
QRTGEMQPEKPANSLQAAASGAECALGLVNDALTQNPRSHTHTLLARRHTPHRPASFFPSTVQPFRTSKDLPSIPSTPGCGPPLPSLESSFIKGSGGHGSDAGVGDEPKLDAKDEGVLEKVRDGDGPGDVDYDAEAGDDNEGEGEVEDEVVLNDEHLASEHVYPSDSPSFITQHLILPMLIIQRSTPYLLLGLKAFYNLLLIAPSANRKGKKRMVKVGVSGVHVPESILDVEAEQILGRPSI